MEEGRCLEFKYGGCRGNANNFEAKKDCEAACKGSEAKVIVSFLKSICTFPMMQGNCSKNLKRYHYDNETNTCQQFEYSGCGGNENRVRTDAFV